MTSCYFIFDVIGSCTRHFLVFDSHFALSFVNVAMFCIMSKLFWFLIKFIWALTNKTIKARLNLTFFDRIWWLLWKNSVMIRSVGTRTLSLNSLFLRCIKELFSVANSCIEFFWSHWIHIWFVIDIIHFFIMKWSTFDRILINSIYSFDTVSLFLSKKEDSFSINSK